MQRRWLVSASALCLVALVQQWTHGRGGTEVAPASRPLPKETVAGVPSGAHPRLLLDGPTRQRLTASAKASTPAWKVVVAHCDRYADGSERSGYQGFDWAYALAELSLCWHATGQRRYSDGALIYLGALLDDKERVGDHLGGDKRIESDSGYAARTIGVYAALGYDWLHDAPGMTAAFRARIVARLTTWLGWYRERGYHRDQPGTNYFLGYAATQILAGLALSGEAAVADTWLNDARQRLLGTLLLPFLRVVFRGGDYPEGWQYGELYAAQLSLIAEAWRTATGVPLAARLPWLADVPTHHLHALLPDGSSVYDGGDWSNRPARGSRMGLTLVAHALESVAPDRASVARFVLSQTKNAEGVAWMELLAERPAATAVSDPRGPTSLHLPSTGLSLMRSAWTPEAVFASFMAGPHLVEDHQHFDQGHFELWRGGDALLVDGADYGSYGTINHNSLLIDDKKRVLDYSPNQGAWGWNVRTTHFQDDGQVAIAVGDLTDAYRPACIRDGCDTRVVERIIRTFVYLRPSMIVIEDRVSLVNASDGVTFVAHTMSAPTIDKTRATATVGASRVDVVAITDQAFSVAKQPTLPDKGYAVQDNPWGPIWRLSLPSTVGAKDRRFVVAAQANDRATTASIMPLHGEHLDGVAAGQRAIVFAVSTGHVTLPAQTRSVQLLSLDPQRGYSARADGCNLTLSDGATHPNPAGILQVEVPACR